jgi:hypothetical protein
MAKHDLQNITQKTKHQVTRTPLKPRGEHSCAPDGSAVPAPHVTPVVLNDTNTISYGTRFGRQYT